MSRSPLGEQSGQPPGGVPVAGVGLGPKSVQVPALGQQLGQQPGGAPVAGVGPGPQSVQVPAVVQQLGQLHGGAPVASSYPFGREPDGTPSQPWKWQEPTS